MDTFDVVQFIRSPLAYLDRFVSVDALDKTIENNDWHLKQSVLDHTLKVLESVDQSLSLEDRYLSRLKPWKSLISAYMLADVGAHPRLDLLKTCALLHDIGKPATIRVQPNGQTTCPNHANESRLLFEQRGDTLLLSENERHYISQIVQKHHEADNFLETIGSQQSETALVSFLSVNSQIVLDLLFFYFFDFEGCRIGDKISALKPTVYDFICHLIESQFGDKRR